MTEIAEAFNAFVALTEATGLKGYAGLYHQAPTPFQLDPALGNPALLPERAFQVGLGVEHRFIPVPNPV